MNLLIRNSVGWSVLFFALVFVAVATQLAKTRNPRPNAVRGFLKAAPALLLAALSFYFHEPLLLALGFIFCACGDILLDIPETSVPWAFPVGAVSFAVALICLSIVYLGAPLPNHPLLLLCLTNIVIALFILRWVVPKIKGPMRIVEVAYFGVLIVSNVIASTSHVPIFLGSSLWLMSDLSIGLSSNVSDTPANSLDTLGLYDLGLYFIGVGFLNS